MDGQQQFLKPAQHVPFYVKRPITIDTSSHPHLFGYGNGSGKPASYSVDLSHSRLSRPRHTDQLSEPINRGQSKSLRDVFEKAILRGDVAIYSPDEESGVMRNPSFITASLPRPDKHNRKAATISGDNYMHIGKGQYHRSTEYFVDSSSESDTDSVGGGKHNDAYLDDASSTISDELFKSTSEGPTVNQEEEEFDIQPLPRLLDIDSSHQAGRSTLGGFFKPKYRDYPRNNVHRSSERQHKEAIDSGTNRNGSKQIAVVSPLHRNGNSLHRADDSLHRDGAMLTYSNRLEPSKDSGRLPRTRLPAHTQGELTSHEHNIGDSRGDSRGDKEGSREGSRSPHMSHNRYLPKKRRPSRPHSPRRETPFNELEDIIPASPEIPRRPTRSSSLPQQRGGHITSAGSPLEQMEVEDPPWMKAEIRERRRRRNKKVCVVVSILSILVVVAVLIAVLAKVLPALKTKLENTTSEPVMDTSTTITSTTTFPSDARRNITLTFDGSMRITNQVFEPALSDLNSNESVELKSQFCGTMERVFSNNNNNNNDFLYGDCNITSFTNGSVVVDFHLDIVAKVKRSRDVNNPQGPDIIDEVDQQKKVIEITNFTNIEWRKPNPGGQDWLVDDINLTLETASKDDHERRSHNDSVTSLPTSSKIKLSTTLPSTTPIQTTTTIPTTRTRTTTSTTSQTTTDRSTTSSTKATISSTTTTQATTPSTTTASTTTLNIFPTTSRRTTTPPMTTRSTPTPLTTTQSTVTTASVTTASTVTTDTLDLATTDQSGEVTTDRSNLASFSNNGCFIQVLNEYCNTAYYKCGEVNGFINCDKGNALSLEITPFPWNKSACSIPVNLDIRGGASLNNGCPSERQYQRYNCTEHVARPLLPMEDFDYVYECCPMGYIFDGNEKVCTECTDCSSADSEDELQGI